MAAGFEYDDNRAARTTQRLADEHRLRRRRVRLVRHRHRQFHRHRLGCRTAGSAGRSAAAATTDPRLRAGPPHRGSATRSAATRTGGCIGVGGDGMAGAQVAGRHPGPGCVSLASAAPGCRPWRRSRHHLPSRAGERGRGLRHQPATSRRARTRRAARDVIVGATDDGWLRDVSAAVAEHTQRR